jgi:hypothetical protein
VTSRTVALNDKEYTIRINSDGRPVGIVVAVKPSAKMGAHTRRVDVRGTLGREVLKLI